MRRVVLVALAAAAVLAVLAGCGSKSDRIEPRGADPLSVMLDFFPNADHVGLYAAIKDGDFRRAGLDVKALVPADPSTPLKLLAAGKVDLAVSYEPELLLARDKGAPLVAVGAIVQRPLTSIISVDPKVKRLRDLAGKTVGTAGIAYQSSYLDTIQSELPGGRIKGVNVGFNLVPAMLGKKVAATLGGFWNYEGIELRQRHKHPLVIPVDQAGVPTYDELVVVARRDTLRNRGRDVRSFIQALGRGYTAARRDPSAAVDALVGEVPDLAKARDLQTASVRATLPAFFPTAKGEPFGYMNRAAWAKYGTWMYDHHLLSRPPHADFALTNEFLAGQGAG